VYAAAPVGEVLVPSVPDWLFRRRIVTALPSWSWNWIVPFSTMR
jgi:hypothetical protein